MNFTITLQEYECEKINWHLTDEYSLLLNCPLNFLSSENKNLELYSDLVRREGAEIQNFLTTLNKAYNKKKKFKKIFVKSSQKSKLENTIIDNFLEGFFLANYTFNRHKSSLKDSSLILETNFNNNISHASVQGACIARDLVNEPLSNLNAEKLSSMLNVLAKE